MRWSEALAHGIEGSNGTEERMRMWGLGCAGVMVAVLCLSAAGSRGVAQTVTPLAKLDFDRFTGTWYEIARYPNKDERRCVGDVMEVIAQGGKANHLQQVRTCHNKDKYTDVKNTTWRAANKSGDGELKSGFIWPFTTKYWVLAVGPEYEWAMAGTPNHKSLWVLSRMSRMKPEVLAQIQRKAAAEGFAPEKLVATPQTRQRAAEVVLRGPASTPTATPEGGVR